MDCFEEKFLRSSESLVGYGMLMFKDDMGALRMRRLYTCWLTQNTLTLTEAVKLIYYTYQKIMRHTTGKTNHIKNKSTVHEQNMAFTCDSNIKQ